jgi:hypothetical protein
MDGSLGAATSLEVPPPVGTDVAVAVSAIGTVAASASRLDAAFKRDAMSCDDGGSECGDWSAVFTGLINWVTVWAVVLSPGAGGTSMNSYCTGALLLLLLLLLFSSLFWLLVGGGLSLFWLLVGGGDGGGDGDGALILRFIID